MNGIHEVRGSIPLSSTKEKKGGMKNAPLFLCHYNKRRKYIDIGLPLP